MNIDVLLDRDTWERFRTLNMMKNSLARDHLIRIRQLDCCCTVVNFHYQPQGFFQELRRRLCDAAARWPAYRDGVGFPTSATQPRAGSTPAQGPSVVVTIVVPPPSLPPSHVIFSRLKSLTGSRLCHPHKNMPHRHVIHVCTCAFFIILLLSLYTVGTHFLSLDYFVETNLPDNVVGSEHHCRDHTKRGLWPNAQNTTSHRL